MVAVELVWVRFTIIVASETLQPFVHSATRIFSTLQGT